MKHRMVAAARILALALGTALAVPQRAPAQTGDEAQLTALARAAVEAQNDILVSGDVEGSLGRRANAAAFRGGIQAHFASLTNRKNVLAQSRNDYKSHRTTLRIKNTRVEGDRATQEATEHVVLTLDPSIGGPPQTEYTQEHVLRFERAGGQWRLSADEILPPPEDPDSLRGPAVTAETRPAPAGHTPNPQIERRGGGPPRPGPDRGRRGRGGSARRARSSTAPGCSGWLRWAAARPRACSPTRPRRP
jgi:hypothetical protein